MTDTKQDELKPCPFCGSDACVGNGPPHLWYVKCNDCGIDGKIMDDRQSAIAAWNKRVAPQGEDQNVALYGRPMQSVEQGKDGAK